MEKSTIYASGLTDLQQVEMKRKFAFELGNLPVRYLGLPLLTKQMTQDDYKPLLEKIRAKISAWTGRFLSFGGRLQLLKSVISSLTNFWIAAFRLPKGCIAELEKLCNAFLWSGPDLNPRKTKVAWLEVCKPKREGGLGLRSVHEANKVCMLKLIWRLLTGNSLWNRWVKDTILKGKTFWEFNESSTKGSWIWKKMIKYRSIARDIFMKHAGNGQSTSFWHERWCSLGVLHDLVGSRGFIDTGIPSSASLHQALTRIRRRRFRTPILVRIDEEIEKHKRSNRINSEDESLWRYKGDIYKPKFNTHATWDLIRQHYPTCSWHNTVWFSKSTPKFAFMTWLALLNRLSTGDRMLTWQTNANSACSLCDESLETRNHLFFECGYSRRVWTSLVQGIMGNEFTVTWQDIVARLTNPDMSKIMTYLLRYAFQAAVHAIWKERNGRRHGERPKTARVLSKVLDKVVRNRICTLPTGSTVHAHGLEAWFSTRIN